MVRTAIQHCMGKYLPTKLCVATYVIFIINNEEHTTESTFLRGSKTFLSRIQIDLRALPFLACKFSFITIFGWLASTWKANYELVHSSGIQRFTPYQNIRIARDSWGLKDIFNVS